MHLLQPHNKVHNMAAKTRKRIGLILTNGQNMCICGKKHCFIVFNTLRTYMLIISSTLTATEGGSNDIYDSVIS